MTNCTAPLRPGTTPLSAYVRSLGAGSACFCCGRPLHQAGGRDELSGSRPGARSTQSASAGAKTAKGRVILTCPHCGAQIGAQMASAEDEGESEPVPQTRVGDLVVAA